MNLTAEQQDKILTTIKECNGNTAKVAHRLRIHETIIQEVDMKVNGTWNYTPEGKGPIHLQKFIVGIRDLRKQASWNNDDPKIASARKLYDAGKVEITTGRDGFNLIMYAIPRLERVQRKPYFVMIEEGQPDNVVHL